MINNYEIKNNNGEEILYLYFDLNNEFSKINFKEQKKKLENIIKDFIKENKIAFTGTSVAIIVGGMLAGNVVLSKEQTKDSTDAQNHIVIEEKLKEDSVDELEVEAKQEEDLKEEVIDEKEDTTVNQEKQEQVEQKKQETINNNTNVVQKQTEQVTNETVSQTTNTSENTESQEQVQEILDNKTYITVRRSSGVVQDIELEDYVLGVVGAEMPASFHDQALMAQAVIARTYALKAKSRGQVLTDNNSTQNYKSNDELRVMWGSSFSTYYNKIKNAVVSTEGLYLTYNGDYIEAVYHSTSNGTTENAYYVWGNSFPYLVSVESTYDSINPSFEMEKTISYEELSSKLQSEITQETNFNILGKTTGNRIENIEINGKVYRGVDFRNILGLRSADFDITKTDDSVIFKTRGYGHGVGMSQYGANGMARNGSSYLQILTHYYRGVILNHL